MNRCFIVVKDKFDGMHYWKGAKNFLGVMHHHQFFVTLKIEAPSDGNMSRQFEFFYVRQVLRDILADMLPKFVADHSDKSNPPIPMTVYSLDGWSVERLSNVLYDELVVRLELEKTHKMVISIFEDNYAGSETFYNL